MISISYFFKNSNVNFRQVSQKMEAGSQTAKDAAGNNILRLEKNSSIKITQQRYPKMSTTSQNIEMKEVLRWVQI